MGQLYLQHFTYRDGVTKEALDAAWTEAFKVWAKSGNWGGVENGVTMLQSYGTGTAGYGVIEVEDADTFAVYQLFHMQNYRARRQHHVGTHLRPWQGVPVND